MESHRCARQGGVPEFSHFRTQDPGTHTWHRRQSHFRKMGALPLDDPALTPTPSLPGCRLLQSSPKPKIAYPAFVPARLPSSPCCLPLAWQDRLGHYRSSPCCLTSSCSLSFLQSWHCGVGFWEHLAVASLCTARLTQVRLCGVTNNLCRPSHYHSSPL